MTDDSLLGQLAEEFTHRVREGKLPDIEEYASCYPELASRIRELFPTLMLLEGMAATGDAGGAAAPPSPLSPGSVFGNYRIGREIGRGGMGIVYEAVHVPLEKRVALKVLPMRMPADAGHLERFFREARTAAGLHHTNIVPVFDVGQVAGTPYFAMQYIEGRGLDQVLRIMQSVAEQGPFAVSPSDSTCDAASGAKHSVGQEIPAHEKERWAVPSPMDASARARAGLPARLEDYFHWVAGVGIQAAEGLAYAHERKVIHRDIKPSNLLLDKQGVLWIADFGLARKLEDPATTQSGAMLGTPRYMSPEQAESARRPVDQRSDIYSLGATLYELLTCHPVFEGKTPQDVLSQILAVEPVAPRRLNPEIPADLATIVTKAMAKRPEDRYQSARELADDLQRWQKMEPIKARPIGPLGRTARWCRRNPKLAAVTAVAAAIVLTLSGFYYWSLIKENASTRAALELAKRQSYAANLTAADLYLREKQTLEARHRLDLCDPSLRGWEWRHLFLRSDSSLSLLYCESGDFTDFPYLMSTFGFSSDGKRFSWNTQYTLHVWDLSTYSQVAIYGGFGPILAANRDGTRILADYPREKAMRVVEPLPGRIVANLSAGTELIECAAFSADGTRIAAGAKSGAAFVWDAASGKVLAHMDGGKAWIRYIAFSPDGTRLATGSADKVVRIYDAHSGKTVQVIRASDSVVSIAFSPDARRLAAGSWDGQILVSDSASGNQIALLKGHGRSVFSIAFSPDGSRIVSAGNDGTVRVWDPSSGEEIAALLGHYNYVDVQSVAFTPDGTRILSGDQLGYVHIWDARRGQGTRIFQGHAGCVTSAVFSPDGLRIASASQDKTIRLWDADSGREIRTLSGHEDGVTSVAISPDGRRLVSGSWDKTAKVWDVQSGMAIVTMKGHQDRITSIAFSPDGRRVLTGSWDKTARVWDATTGSGILTIYLDCPVNSVAFSPDSTRILTASGDPGRSLPDKGNAVQVWSAETGDNLANLNLAEIDEKPEKSAASAVAFSPDGRRIAAAFTMYSYIGIWDAHSAKQLATLKGQSSGIESICFSPDGKRILSGSQLGGALLWDAFTYEPLLALSGYESKFTTTLSFSPDGTRIVSGTKDNGIKIWDSRSAYHPEAERFFSSLFEKYTFADDVIRALEGDTRLDPELRKAALQLVHARGDSPARLNTESWAIVKSPDCRLEACRRALKMADVASRLVPWKPSYLNTLAVAQYRLGAYKDALASLTRCASLRENPAAADLAFMAMANFKLGNIDQARVRLDQLRTLMKAPGRSGNAELRGFLREAESLIDRR